MEGGGAVGRALVRVVPEPLSVVTYDALKTTFQVCWLTWHNVI